MPAPKRSPFQREHDMAMIAKWYAQQKPVAVIAADLQVSISQVRYDIETVKKRWLQDQISAFDERIMMQLAKLDMAEREAWEAWESSKAEKVTTTTEKTEGDKATTKAQLKKEQRNGDISYFNAAMDVIRERSKLLGLYAAEKVDATITTHNTNVNYNVDVPDLSMMTIQEIEAARNASAAKLAALQGVGTPLIIDAEFTPLPDHPALPIADEQYHLD